MLAHSPITTGTTTVKVIQKRLLSDPHWSIVTLATCTSLARESTSLSCCIMTIWWVEGVFLVEGVC